MKTGRLFVISGPSGAGKGTICQRLLSGAGDGEAGDPELSISATTRAPRPGEKNGVSYHFVTDEEFRRMIDNDDFLEYAEVFDRFYGTPKRAVMRKLEEGHDVLLEIDVQGALQVKRNYPKSILVFILPPSIGELKKRIEGRGSESAEQIMKRLGEAAREIGTIDAYDYAIVNDDIDKTVAELKDVMSGRRTRMDQEEAREIIDRFRADAAGIVIS
jgi:guanylate kinase